MAIAFHDVWWEPLEGLSVVAPSGFVIGLVGDEGCGARELLRVGAGLVAPWRGSVEGPSSRRLIGHEDALDFSSVEALLLDHALALRDAVSRAQAAMALVGLAREGATVLAASHEERLLAQLCDEIWWLEAGRLAAKGDPREILERYRGHAAERIRACGAGRNAPLAVARRGDGRAELASIETLDESRSPTMVWRSGEQAVVSIVVRYHEAIDDPVVGILIRTRIGFEVYGTNTELEGIKLGPCAAGDSLRVVFSFLCDLCPGDYTITAASHDPDGALHEWVDDAVAFSVADSRYAAGVANLRARVSVERLC